MADNRGGYQQPANPAPVSGPGSLSQRTDGGPIDGVQPQTQGAKYMPGLPYGEGGNMEQQSGAPLAGNDIPKVVTPEAIPLSAPSRSNLPDQSGLDFGPGPDSSAIRPVNMSFSPSHTLRQIAANDPTGESALLEQSLANLGY